MPSANVKFPEKVYTVVDGVAYEVEDGRETTGYIVVWTVPLEYLIGDIFFNNATETAFLSYNTEGYENQPVPYFELRHLTAEEICAWIVRKHPAKKS